MEDTSSVHYLNLEYFFRLLYEALLGGQGTGTLDFTALINLANALWLVVTALAIIISFVAIWIFLQATIRLYQIRNEEHHKYGTVTFEEADKQVDHSRWKHIQELMLSGQESDHRQAIIEADIMLEEVLIQMGHSAPSVGDMLRQVDPQRLHTLQQAWDAHRVRNDIAHRGSAMELSEQLAHRTIAQYEAVFREVGEI